VPRWLRFCFNSPIFLWLWKDVGLCPCSSGKRFISRSQNDESLFLPPTPTPPKQQQKPPPKPPPNTPPLSSAKGKESRFRKIDLPLLLPVFRKVSLSPCGRLFLVDRPLPPHEPPPFFPILAILGAVSLFFSVEVFSEYLFFEKDVRCFSRQCSRLCRPAPCSFAAARFFP